MTNKIILKDAFKRFTLDQDKIMPPEETVIRFKKKLKQVDLDILDYTVRIDKRRLHPDLFQQLWQRCHRNNRNEKADGKRSHPSTG